MAVGRVVAARWVVVLERTGADVDANDAPDPETTQADATPPMTPATNPGSMLRKEEWFDICDPFTPRQIVCR